MTSAESEARKALNRLRRAMEKAEREIPSRVLNAQSVKVDTVTRATASSMVILKAIEKALTQ